MQQSLSKLGNFFYNSADCLDVFAQSFIFFFRERVFVRFHCACEGISIVSALVITGSADELNKKRDDLYQQENQLFADHKDAWDKVFGLMNKNTDGDAMNENYAARFCCGRRFLFCIGC